MWSPAVRALLCFAALAVSSPAFAQQGHTDEELQDLADKIRDEEPAPEGDEGAELQEGERNLSLDQMEEHFQADDPKRRARGADLAGRYGHDNRAALIPQLRRLARHDSHGKVRAAAVRALGRLEARRALPEFVHALRDEQSNVRLVAAAALWRVPDVTAVPVLIERLDDPDPLVRQWAANALGNAVDLRAWKPLLDRLDDPSPKVATDVMRSLLRYRRYGVDEFVRAVEDVAGSPRRKPEVRVRAMDTLVKLAESRQTQDDGEPKTERDPLRSLIRLLQAPSPYVRAHAARRLGQIGGKTPVAALKRRLWREPSRRVRQALRGAIRAARQRTDDERQ